MHLLLALALAVLGPFTAANNYATNLMGPTDTRVDTWGTADSQVWQQSFRPPAGYRVRVLRLWGDLVAWPMVLPGERPVAPGQYAGVLVGFQTTARDGSDRCWPCADNTLLYLQGAMHAEPVRIPFDQRVSTLLEADNILAVKVADWLNTLGRPVHMEVTYRVTYRFEKETN